MRRSEAITRFGPHAEGIRLTARLPHLNCARPRLLGALYGVPLAQDRVKGRVLPTCMSAQFYRRVASTECESAWRPLDPSRTPSASATPANVLRPPPAEHRSPPTAGIRTQTS